MNRYFLTIATLAFIFTSPIDANAGKKTSVKTYKMLELLGEVLDRVDEEYVEDVDEQKLLENAMNGMLSSLDPHSGYLNEEEYSEMQVQTSGQFGGLGIEVTMENGLVKVVTPIEDTPAYKAGLKAGDYITHLDGEQVLGLSLSDAVKKMRGPVDTKIELTIRRKGKPSFEVVITRDIIKLKAVKVRVEDEDIGYLRVTTFSEKVDYNLKKEIAKIKKKQGDKIKGYVLDLRNNPGGLLDQAVAVSDLFLEHGEIVSTRAKKKKDIQRFSAKPGDIIDGLPLVVLINDGSASASEIVAGALKDHKRAIIMGVKSFGKGSVQTVLPISNYGAIKLTTARYYTPSGTSIQAKGIEPDIEVHPAKVEELDVYPARSEAELRNALTNEQAEDKKKKDSKSKDEEEKTEDYQLQRAIDLIRGLSIYYNKDKK